MASSLFPLVRAFFVLTSVLIASASVSQAAQITSSLDDGAVLGTPWHYQITADNEPTSFAASGLPSGLKINTTTGEIFGAPGLPGDYKIHLSAFGSGTAEANLSVRVYLPIPEDDPPETIIPGGVYPVMADPIVADPKRSRIYCAHSGGIIVIDTDTKSVIKSIATPYVTSLALSADGNHLWFTSTTIVYHLARLDLDNLDTTVQFPLDDDLSMVREGMDNRLFAAAIDGDVLQIDATTGEIQQRFRPNPDVRAYGPCKLEISADRKTLYIADSLYVGLSLNLYSTLSRYDVTSGIPVLLQRVEIADYFPWSITADAKGQSIYVIPSNIWGNWSTTNTLCFAAQDLSQLRGKFSYRGTAQPPTFSPDGRLLIQSVIRTDGGALSSGFIEVFDTTTFALLKTITVGTTWSIGGGVSILMSSAVADRDYSHLYVWSDANVHFGAKTGMFVYSTESHDPPPAITPPKSLLNLATRMVTDRGDSALIGGFIVTGSDPKQVVVRAIGPSLPIPASLANPMLEIYDSTGKQVAENDDWNSNRFTVLTTGLAPPDEHEAAVSSILEAGAYTVVVRGASDTAGVSLVEIYDLNPAANSRIANLSTRGKVETGDNVMIGGIIIGGAVSTNVVVRAIGPSLRSSGITDALSDPTLDLYDGNGVVVAQNDDWRTNQEQQLTDSGLAPKDNKESALMFAAMPGAYTAIVRGKGGQIGVGLVEFYNLQ